MTDNEIMKALEMCIPIEHNCSLCPLSEEIYCCNHLLREVFDLYNRQKAEIISRTEEYNDMLEQRNKVEEALEVMTMEVNSLTSERDALNEMVAEQKADIERLKGHQKDGFFNLLGNCLVFSKTLEEYNDMRKGLKAEAIKEFAERLKKHCYFDHKDQRNVVAEVIIDHYVKEMTEQKE